MNLRQIPDSSGVSSSEDEDDKKKTYIVINWTQQVNLCILIFLAGVVTASILTLAFGQYFGNLVNHHNSQRLFETGGLLPDPDTLRVVDESRYFTTQLQKFDKAEEKVSDEASEAEALKNLQAAILFKLKGNTKV
jgi:hypothetical protein